MLAIIFLLPLILFALFSGLLLSVAALYFGGRMEPRLGKNNLICFLGIVLGIFLWIIFIFSLTNVEVSAQNLEDFPRALLHIFLLGLTPSAGLPALILYGSGKKSRTTE